MPGFIGGMGQRRNEHAAHDRGEKESLHGPLPGPRPAGSDATTQAFSEQAKAGPFVTSIAGHGFARVPGSRHGVRLIALKNARNTVVRLADWGATLVGIDV